MSGTFVPPRYLTARDLHSLLLDPSKSSTLLIVDVRDEDFEGGNIAGALNVPSDEFQESIDRVYAAASGKESIIFHCALSQQRGPRCARFMAEHVATNGRNDGFPNIFILEKGFSGWAKYLAGLEEETRKENRERLIENYDKETHGYNI